MRRETSGGRRWSAAVTKKSNALDLEPKVFSMAARPLALSLERSAEHVFGLKKRGES
ncbi:MAG TPA: DUF3175 domain-containing protein [Polyangia bacterium]|nr:DUF3175 domain-containing protein [Polyangia bacterium]